VTAVERGFSLGGRLHVCAVVERRGHGTSELLPYSISWARLYSSYRPFA